MQDTFPIVAAGSFLTLHYRLSGPDGGDIVNTFDGQPATLSLGTGELAPALEARLIGLPEGAHRVFETSAGEVFGQHNPQLQQWVARGLLERLGLPDEHYEVGEVLRFPVPLTADAPPGAGARGEYAGTVREVQPQRILFDFNHPLAGRPVRFEVQLIAVL